MRAGGCALTVSAAVATILLIQSAPTLAQAADPIRAATRAVRIGSVPPLSGIGDLTRIPDADLPDFKRDFDLPVPAGRSDPAGFSRSSASSFPTSLSFTLWTGYYDIATFTSGGTDYAVAAVEPGLVFYNLSTGSPLPYYTWYTDLGTYRLEVEGTRLYVVDWHETRVFIFDISNPGSPSLLGEYEPAVSGRILNIAAENNVIYLARSTLGIEIVDVSTPSSPSPLNTYLGGSRSVDVAVSNGYAFITVAALGFEVLNVTTPSNPLWYDDYNPGDRNYVQVDFLPGGAFHSADILCFGGLMTDPGTAGYELTVDFYTWNASTHTLGGAPQEVHLTGNSSGVWDVELFENQAYVAFGGLNPVAIDITNITSGTTPSFVGSTTGKFTPNGLAVAPTGRSLLVAELLGGTSQFSLLDAGTPLTELARAGESGRVYMTHRRGDLLFVANGHTGLTVLDVSAPSAPLVINRYVSDGWVKDLSVDWPWIYVAESTAGVTVLTYDESGNSFTDYGSIAPPTDRLVEHLELKTAGPGEYEYLYATAGLGGLMIINVSDPASAWLVNTIAYSGAGTVGSTDLTYVEDWDQLAVANDEDGVDVWDIFTPGSPSLAFTVPPAFSQSNRVAADDDGNLWVTDTNAQIDAYDISTGSYTWLGSWAVAGGDYMMLTPFETNAMLADGYWGVRILNWDDPTAVYEETGVASAGFTRQVTPGTDWFAASDTYLLSIYETPADLFLGLSPAGEEYLPVGDQLQYTPSGGVGSYYYWVDHHPVDDREIATVNATGQLSALAAGTTWLYVYDDGGRWGRAGPIHVWGGPTLIDETVEQFVYALVDNGTWLYIDPFTFDEAVELEIFSLDINTQVPAPPSGYEHFVAYDLFGQLFWSATPLAAGDFNAPVEFNVHYDPAGLPGSYPEDNLTLWRYNDSNFQWEQISATVNAADDEILASLTGFSTYSVMYSLTTLSTPVLSGPADNSWLNTSTVDFAWQSVADATEYDIEVAVTANFDPTDIVNSWTEYGTTAQLDLGMASPYEADGEYFWRVQASDGFFTSDWSNTWAFKVDTTTPGLTVDPLGSPLYNTTATVDATATDNMQLEWVRLLYRPTGTTDWNHMTMSSTGGDGYSGDVPAWAAGYDGFQYLVVARDMAGNENRATSDGTVGEGVSGGVQMGFTGLPASGNIPPEGWLMVSVPHYPDNSYIQDILTGVGEYDDTVWRFFRWNNGGYQEVSGANLETGRAYWLHHRSSGVHFEIGTGETIDTGNPFQITLNPGWNDIGSPWLFDVDWGEILTASGLTGTQVAGVYTYNGSDWGLPAVGQDVPVWRGVSVYNRTSGSLTLQIPPVDASAALAGEASRGADEVFDGWRLQLLLSQEGSAAVDDQNYIGVRAGSEIEWDPGDYPDPPMSIDGTARLAVNRLERSSDPGTYATDYVPGVGEGYTWPLMVESISGQRRASLTVSGIEALPDGYEAVLVDPAAGLRIDCEGRAPYRFYPVRNAAVSLGQVVRRELRLLVGTPGWLAGMTAGLERLPARVELHPNYPNPFNPVTTLRFALREAGEVRLEIRNVRGQLVTVIADRNFEAGTHTLSWNGTDRHGRAVASGIYLARLQAGTEVRIRKMTLVR